MPPNPPTGSDNPSSKPPIFQMPASTPIPPLHPYSTKPADSSTSRPAGSGAGVGASAPAAAGSASSASGLSSSQQQQQQQQPSGQGSGASAPTPTSATSLRPSYATAYPDSRRGEFPECMSGVQKDAYTGQRRARRSHRLLSLARRRPSQPLTHIRVTATQVSHTTTITITTTITRTRAPSGRVRLRLLQPGPAGRTLDPATAQAHQRPAVLLERGRPSLRRPRPRPPRPRRRLAEAYSADLAMPPIRSASSLTELISSESVMLLERANAKHESVMRRSHGRMPTPRKLRQRPRPYCRLLRRARPKAYPG